MTTLYRPLPEALFSSAWFRKLRSAEAKLVLLTLAAGPCMTGCPGLAQTDRYAIAGLCGLDLDAVDRALAELVGAGLAEVDDDHRLVRLPWLPAMRGTASYKTLKGWWGCFLELPASGLRDRHAADLRHGVSFAGEQMAETWAATFGTIKPSTSPSEALSKPLCSPCQDADADADANATQTNTHAGPPAAGVLVPVAPGDADLEAVYRLYPRKEGKTAGMKQLRRDVRTHAALADFKRAVEAYARLTRDWPPDKRKHFSTFVGCWREYLDPSVVASAEAASAARGNPKGARGSAPPMQPVEQGGDVELP